MECERATELLSPYMDGELDSAEIPALEAHLAGCAGCRASIDVLQAQDAALVRAFAQQRQQADSAANHALSALAGEASLTTIKRSALPVGTCGRWWIPLATAAAGFALALIVRSWIDRRNDAARLAGDDAAGARLIAAKGQVLISPFESDQWQPISIGNPVRVPSRIRTDPRGRCELQYPDGSILRFSGGSEARLTANRSIEVASAVGVPEMDVAARVNTLLAQLPIPMPVGNIEPFPVSQPTPSRAPDPIEQQLRALGGTGAAVLAGALRRAELPASAAARRTTLRVVCDLAPIESVPDLIDLLADSGADVRIAVLSALHRITGRPSPNIYACETDSPQAMKDRQSDWRNWWEQNGARRESVP